MKTAILGVLFLCLLHSTQAADDRNGERLYKTGLYHAAKTYLLQQMKHAPLSSEDYYYLGNSYFRLYRPDSAAFYYTKGVEANPDCPLNYIGQAKLVLKSSSAEATALFDKADAIKGGRKSVDALLAKNEAYSAAGHTEEAMECMESAKKYAPQNAAVYLAEGDQLMEAQRAGEACSKYDMAVYYDPACVPAYLKLADVYASTNSAMAFEKLQKAAEIAPDFPATWLYLGDLHRSSGRYAKAVAAYEQYIASGLATADQQLRYADCLYFSDCYDRLVPVVNAVLAADPNNLVAKRLRAYAVGKKGNDDESLRIIADFITSVPENNLIVQDYLCYAEQLADAKQYDRALEQYKKALTLDAKRSETLLAIADTQMKRKDFTAARQSYLDYFALIQKPTPEDLLRLGKCYYTIAAQDTAASPARCATLQQADSVFAALTQLVPDSYVGYFWRARTNSLLDPESTAGLAKPYYEKIIEIALRTPSRYISELVESYKYLGYHHYIIGNSAIAKGYFGKVLELIPNDEVSQRALKEIK